MLKLLNNQDFTFCKSLLPRLDKDHFSIYLNSSLGYLLYDESNNKIGLLFYTVLWERFPFIEHIIIKDNYQHKGYGTKAILEFENLMKDKNYKVILLSTQVDEKAQFLYRKLGYIDCGRLVLENTPYDQPLELFMKKNLA